MNARVSEWYAGRRVFITGHTGFKGAWLTAWLRDAGATITAYALPPETDRPSLYALAHVEQGIDSVLADVRDGDTLEKTLRNAKPEIVFHLAAQSLVRRSYADPVYTFETNVVGTARLLDAIRRTPSVRAVVVVTSDKCYENRDTDRAYREDDAMGGHDPYSASKGAQELVTAAFRRSFLAPANIPVASARAGNVVGGGDWSEDRLIADLMRGVSAGKPAQVRNPDAVRPWQHVLEPLRGYLMLGRALAEKGAAFAEAWNFGPQLADAISVRDLVARITAAWPLVRTEFVPQPGAPHEARLLRLDNSKAADRLGWTPKLTIGETVAMTVEWYRVVHDDPSCATAMLKTQLNNYE
ncbi:MAG TPA: CDP-glucose 4,6-dehydratase [Gemmatimonadaceae bacterium]|nr:CDP-glucose 4,6-dehydratase [Gemmatimonadaceae bacterium]